MVAGVAFMATLWKESALWLKDGFNFLPQRGGGEAAGGGDFVVWGPSAGIYLPPYAANLQNLEIPISDMDEFCLM